eukprot:scaffold80357_cov63-Phaeocystis_antarctica.AAC.2
MPPPSHVGAPQSTVRSTASRSSQGHSSRCTWSKAADNPGHCTAMRSVSITRRTLLSTTVSVPRPTGAWAHAERISSTVGPPPARALRGRQLDSRAHMLGLSSFDRMGTADDPLHTRWSGSASAKSQSCAARALGGGSSSIATWSSVDMEMETRLTAGAWIGSLRPSIVCSSTQTPPSSLVGIAFCGVSLAGPWLDRGAHRAPELNNS